VDDIILVSPTGKKMYRETDLIDVWFDSGAMPYAQWHFPWERTIGDQAKPALPFPADFIAEGVDQTRGWFFTLHAISTMVSESVSFRNIISNGLILDKNGVKMSKKLGNSVDPFETLEKFGADPLRWYLITNSQPWDNLKFDIDGVDEVKRKFFGTLFNTYSFFALYANVDHFRYSEPEVPVSERPELDRWIISLLNSLIAEVTDGYENYEPTNAGRVIADFVIENLSNWFVRLSRKRYWGGEYDLNKISAYQTLYTCLSTLARLIAPIAPFYADLLYSDLNNITQKEPVQSVHLADFPVSDPSMIDKSLEEKMDIAQKASSMILSLRRKEKIKVRQPLAKIMVPVLNDHFREQFEAVKNILLTEVNVKEVEFLNDTSEIIHKKIKPNFKILGPKAGKLMKEISQKISGLSQQEISEFEKSGGCEIQTGSGRFTLQPDDVEITTEDIPGWLVATEGNLTIALDIHINEALKMEGIAREFINKIHNIRKESNFQVTDRIGVQIRKHPMLDNAVVTHREYISMQTLAASLELVSDPDAACSKLIEIEPGVETLVSVEKIEKQ